MLPYVPLVSMNISQKQNSGQQKESHHHHCRWKTIIETPRRFSSNSLASSNSALARLKYDFARGLPRLDPCGAGASFISPASSNSINACCLSLNKNVTSQDLPLLKPVQRNIYLTLGMRKNELLQQVHVPQRLLHNRLLVPMSISARLDL